MAEKKHIPAIRFKGFFDDWVSSTLGEVAEIKSGSTPLRSNPLFYENGNIPWVKTTDLNNSHITKTEEKITTRAKARVNPSNSVLVAMYGGFNQIGRTGLLAVPAATNQALSVLNTNEGEVLALYLLTWLNAKVDFWIRFAGSSRKDPNITGSDVSVFPIVFPKTKEQTQIGSYFQNLDKLISLHQTKVNKLINLKKAMLEKMFPKNGADVPEIRFKGFEGAWEEKTLAGLGEIVTGSTPSTQESTYYSNDGIPWVTPTDISENVTFHTAKHLSKEGQTVARVVPKNSILVTSIASIGKNTLLGTTGSFNQQINALVPNEKENDPYFLFTESALWSNKMKRSAASGTMQIVNKTEFSEIKTIVPKLNEQRKIGTYFQNLDKLISLHQSELNKLNHLKKACLEKMFV